MRHAPVRYAPVRYAPVRWYKPPEGSPEGVPFSEASSRAKRGRPAERSERGSAEPRSEAARRSSGGRHYKKTQKGSTRKPRGTTYIQISTVASRGTLFRKNSDDGFGALVYYVPVYKSESSGVPEFRVRSSELQHK